MTFRPSRWASSSSRGVHWPTPHVRNESPPAFANSSLGPPPPPPLMKNGFLLTSNCHLPPRVDELDVGGIRAPRKGLQQQAAQQDNGQSGKQRGHLQSNHGFSGGGRGREIRSLTLPEHIRLPRQVQARARGGPSGASPAIFPRFSAKRRIPPPSRQASAPRSPVRHRHDCAVQRRTKRRKVRPHA